MNGKTLHDIIRSAALANRDKTAFHFFRDDWQTMTYAEFLSRTDEIFSLLSERGITRDDRVAIMCENRPEWPASYLAILMAGGQAVPVDVRLTPPEVRNILTDSEARCIIHSGENEVAVREAVSGIDIDLLDLDSSDRSEGRSVPEPVETGEDDVAALLYTSGTTGAPKAVMLTHGNLCSDAYAALNAGIVSGSDNVLAMLPFHHTYPFMCTFVLPMLLGAGITFPAGLKGPELIAAIKENCVTVLLGVPQVLELMRNRMYERIGESSLSWPLGKLIKLSGFLRRRWDINLMGRVFRPLGRQFRFLASGGARLDPGVMTDLEALGFTVVEGYGLTETSPIVAFNPPEKRKPGSAGIPLSPAEIKILSPSETGEGEIAIRGPMVMKGYYRKPEETAAVMQDGWFRSGDLGYIDDDGYVFITGRVKEMIVLGSGKKVYPEEVEKHYLKCPLVKELCVLEEGGRLTAVIVPDTVRAKAEGVGSIDETLRWQINELSGQLPPHMRIKGYTLRSEPLPRTPLGKLRRFMIGQEARAAKPEGAEEEDKTLRDTEEGRAIVDVLRRLLGEATVIRASHNLELDLGLDSLMRVELAASLERALDVKIPEDLMSAVQTVGELKERITEIRKTGAKAEEKGEGGIEAVLTGEPTEEEKARVGLARSTLEWPVAASLITVLKLLFRLLFRLEVRGIENIPKPPCIIAANHASYLDGFAVGAGVPLGLFKELYFLGVQQYFAGRATSLFGRLAHVIPIDPDAHLHNALKLSSYVLRNGNYLLIFPEGGRTFDGEIMPFKKGIGILARTLGMSVVPAKIEGTYDILPRGTARVRPGRIRITFGRPMTPSEVEGAGMPEGVDENQFFADELRKRIIAL